MSRFTRTAATSHALSTAAMEEASRLGQREADIDHLLLALTVSEQPAGRVLRDLGVTLDAARDAVGAQHAEQLESLGLTVAMPGPGRIVFHETGSYTWTDRCVDVLKQAASGDQQGDATAVLRALVAEPSGLVVALLRRLDVEPDTLLARLDAPPAAAAPESPATTEPRPGAMTRQSQVFVPASIDEVWLLVSDPARLPEWDASLARVDAVDASDPAPGDAWEGRTPTVQPDGTPVEVQPELRRQVVELHELDPRVHVAWRITYPDSPRSNARTIRVALAPSTGGTDLSLSLTWERVAPDGLRARALRLAARPILHTALWFQLSQLGSGISRAFR
ncbi:SRPBCC family protein [Nocardioides sp. J2M5]|uniref:SRPBCC family protein n=1 Tax=Nocardioides palaemonis TaxID=2829810 RepID=UPI001BA7D063|nr:Clp protease N-terminal domain-containing protein [Nocardioides palaemonis]MBS2936791.1 SRPBCC family protein [Nocardioides palaemonis]